MDHRGRGFTLMEMMVTLALAGVILAIGAPSFTEFRRNNRLVGVANDLLGTAQVARTEAIKRQVPVAVCPSGNPDATAATCSTAQAFPGWIAFVDTNNNCIRETAEIVLRAGATVDSAVSSRSNGNCISFAPGGFRQAVAGKTTASNTVFCDSRGYALQGGTNLSAARGIDIGPTGRVRITRDKTEMTTGPPGSGWGLACP
jgi:type IV fimbrial biogenesis protein FimT